MPAAGIRPAFWPGPPDTSAIVGRCRLAHRDCRRPQRTRSKSACRRSSRPPGTARREGRQRKRSCSIPQMPRSPYFRSPPSFSILLVADLFHPFDILAVERFRDRDMAHRDRRCRAVPVLLARRKPDDIAGADFFDGSTLTLRPAKPGRNDECLAKRMGVPHGPSTRFEGDLATTKALWVSHLKKGVHSHCAGEPCLGAFTGWSGAVAFDIHRSIPSLVGILCRRLCKARTHQCQHGQTGRVREHGPSRDLDLRFLHAWSVHDSRLDSWLREYLNVSCTRHLSRARDLP